MRADGQQINHHAMRGEEKSVSSYCQLAELPWITSCSKPLHILLVDKDDAVLKSLQPLLEKAGHRSFSAFDSDAAIDIFFREHIDIVVTDLELQPASGLMLLKKMRKIRKNISIIIITDDRKVSLPIKVFQEGADDFLLKPFTFITLMDAIERCHSMRQEEEMFESTFS